MNKDPLEEFSTEELLRLGKKAALKERAELIDNCYRARLIPDYSNVSLTTKELRALWANY